jgi:predicted RNA-binding protein associated with RNAse of E/G family
LTGDLVTIRYRRLPNRERTFRQLLVSETAEVTVTLLAEAPIDQPVVTGGVEILEPGAPVVWFTYPGLWYDIGRFHLRDGTFTGFYANILTPVNMRGKQWDTTDLLLDVWKGGNGAVELLDEDEFEAALGAGWLDGKTAECARSTAAALIRRALSGEWPPAHVHHWDLERARSTLARHLRKPGHPEAGGPSE